MGGYRWWWSHLSFVNCTALLPSIHCITQECSKYKTCYSDIENDAFIWFYSEDKGTFTWISRLKTGVCWKFPHSWWINLWMEICLLFFSLPKWHVLMQHINQGVIQQVKTSWRDSTRRQILTNEKNIQSNNPSNSIFSIYYAWKKVMLVKSTASSCWARVNSWSFRRILCA